MKRKLLRIQPRGWSEAGTSIENNEQEYENVSSTEESEVERSSAIPPIVDLRDYDIGEKTSLSFHINYIFQKLKLENAAADDNYKKAEYNILDELKPSIHKTWLI